MNVQENAPGAARHPPADADKPSVALALGAGGAKGLAHIGVIEEIEAQGYRIVAIAGSSMGALIGGIHAMVKMDVSGDWVCALARFAVLRLLGWTFSVGGLMKGERIIGTLRGLIGDTLIEELPLAFTAVATDIDSGREVWLSQGSLFDAIRASIAVPTVFRPHRLNGRRMVDGALLNPVPVTPLIRSEADYVLAVSVDGPAETIAAPAPVANGTVDETSYRHRIGEFISRLVPHGESQPREPGTLDTLNQAMDLMQANLSRLRLAAYEPDLLIELRRAQARQALAAWPHSGAAVRSG